jgi:hypothetical protein
MFRQLFATVTILAGLPAAASDYKPAMQDFLDSQVIDWTDSQVLIDAINGQNAVTGGYDEAQVIALDQAWRSELGTSETPTVTPILTNAAADFLRERVQASGGRISEIFIMDAQGLNVAASVATSDMWQGDEDKFNKTYPAGTGAVHFGAVELDESTQRYQAQVSLTITDPTTGAPIGAMTIGVDAEFLM